MKSFAKNGITSTMTYDADGLRSSKTVAGVKTTYQYVGDKLFYEKRGDGNSFYYFYDSYGKLSAIYHHVNGTQVPYHVVTNAQGDVVALYNWSGNTKVAEYSYDAWGNCTIVSDTTSTHIATLNPFRYRGYYRDTDLGLYYLQSRYYDSEIGRFINADSTGLLAVSSGEITDKNLFSYCDNNPVTRVDVTGDVWETVFDLVSLGFSIYDVVKNPNDVWAWAGLVGDAIDLMPFVAGVGESIKIAKVAKKATDTVDVVYDSAKTVNCIANTTTDLATKIPVIGKMSDLDVYKLAPNEFKVADLLPDKGSPQLNWKQNSSVLRKFADGRPIRDVSPYPMKNAGFLGAERNLLMNRGYTYSGSLWTKIG